MQQVSCSVGWRWSRRIASSTSSSVIRLVWHQLFFDRHFVDSRISIAPNWFHFLDRMPGISQRSITCPNPSILPFGLMTASRSVGRGSDQRAIDEEAAKEEEDTNCKEIMIIRWRWMMKQEGKHFSRTDHMKNTYTAHNSGRRTCGRKKEYYWGNGILI